MPRFTQNMSAGLVAMAAGSAAAQPVYTTVALTGDPVPGGAIDEAFAEFRTPMLNESGVVAFRAVVLGPDVTADNDGGIWTGPVGGLQKIAREGDSAPGTSGGVFYDEVLNPFSLNIALNDAGQVAFRASLRGAGVSLLTDEGLWVGVPSSVSLLARGGDFAPGTPDFSYLSFSLDPTLNDEGVAAFGSTMTGDGVTGANDLGSWSGTPAGVDPVALEGTQATGAGAGQLYLVPTVAAIAPTKAVVFRGSLTGPGVTPANSEAVWSGLPGALSLMARGGQAAPGTPAGVVFDDFGFLFPSINGSNQIATFATLTGPGIGFTNDRGVWAGAPGSLALAIRGDDTVVGGLPGEIVTNFGAPVIADDGTVAVSASTFVPPIGRSGIFAGPAGAMLPVVLEDEPAPGTGVSFGDLFADSVALSDTGRLLVLTELAGPGVDASNDRAIYAQDAAGVLTLIAREGDVFDVDDGPAVDARVIASLRVQRGSGGSDGRGRGINDAGQIVFAATFTDETEGVFIAAIDSTCVPDTNGDGLLTPADFNAWILAFNTNAPACDQNGDNACTPADFNAWILNFNAGC